MNVFDEDGYLNADNPAVVNEVCNAARQIMTLCDVRKLTDDGAKRLFVVHTSSSTFLSPGVLNEDQYAIYGFDVSGDRLRPHSVSVARGDMDTVHTALDALNRCAGESRLAYPAEGTPGTVAVYAIFPDDPRAN